MKNVLFKLILLFLLLGSASAGAQEAYQVIDTRTGWSVSLKEMIYQLSRSNVVIFGEEHNDATAHMLELEILRGLHQMADEKVTLSMEMFERDIQGVMDEYLAGFISEKNFIREARAWSNYNDYKPLIEYAKAEGIYVLCANSPARYTNMVTRGSLKSLDKLPKATRSKYLPPLPVDTLEGRYYEKFLEAMGGHTVPGMHIYQSQNLWDATMARSIIKVMESNPDGVVFHLNGRFHSDEFLGVAKRVKDDAGTSYKVTTISCFPGESYDESDKRVLADYVILTFNKK